MSLFAKKRKQGGGLGKFAAERRTKQSRGLGKFRDKSHERVKEDARRQLKEAEERYEASFDAERAAYHKLDKLERKKIGRDESAIEEARDEYKRKVRANQTAYSTLMNMSGRTRRILG